MRWKVCFGFLLWIPLCISGCTKAVEKAVVPPPERVRVELNGPYDGEIPREYRDRLLAADAADRLPPHLFVGVAGHFEMEGEEAKALHFLDRAAELFAGRKDPAGKALVFC